jgi:predicted enzyme related to lactoylglutathione lyase
MTETPVVFRVAIQVSNAEDAARFYSALLGPSGRPIRGGRYYFDCGPVILAPVTSPDGRATPTPDDIYFSVKGLSAAHARAAALGCFAKGEFHDKPAGKIMVRPCVERSFHAVDPYGNELCFVDADTLFTGR